jgi:HD-GYP domain-containing protein (c-di-GMP phosphodiesterase class II)
MAEYDFYDGLSRVISQLTAAVMNTSLYSPTHPQVAQYIDKANTVLTEILQLKPEITILLIGDDLVADNRQIISTGTASFVANFARILKKKTIERITFVSGLPRAELQGLIQDLASRDATPVRSTTCIKLGKIELRIKKPAEQGTSGGDDLIKTIVESASDIPEEAMQELLSLTAAELDELKELYLQAKRHKKIDLRSVDDMVKGFIKGFRQEINPLNLLASLKSANEYTFTHVTNVCILTMSLAEFVGFKGENLHRIGVASLLHDIGKIFIPDEILSKPGVLTLEERRTIETHTVKGARYLMDVEGIPKLAVLAALEHHQKFDGNGYPSIKGGWTPNITSQLISIADVFDAMRSRRSYQQSQSLEKIEGVLTKGKGTSFNPILIDHFLKMIQR